MKARKNHHPATRVVEHDDIVPTPHGAILRLQVGDTVVPGDLHIPAGASGLVLFVHGSSGSSRHSPRNQAVAEVLRESGLATLLFDLLTSDEERDDVYTGAFRFNIALLADRLIAVTEQMASDERALGLPIGFFGASTGAAAALVAAATLGPKVRAIVSRGGRPDLAGDALSRVHTPTLLIVGGADAPVLAANHEALGRLRCEGELAIVPRATHLFTEPGALQEVARLAADWFQQYLEPGV